MPARFRIDHTVLAAIRWPSPVSSPWILRYPQVGFSEASRSTSWRSSDAVDRPPVRRRDWVQRRVTRSRCHATNWQKIRYISRIATTDDHARGPPPAIPQVTTVDDQFGTHTVVTAAMDVIVMVGPGAEVGQPAQRAETWQEAVLAATSDDKTLDAVQATPDRSLRDRKAAGAVVIAHEQVLLLIEAGEVAVVEPLRLD